MIDCVQPLKGVFLCAMKMAVCVEGVEEKKKPLNFFFIIQKTRGKFFFRWDFPDLPGTCGKKNQCASSSITLPYFLPQHLTAESAQQGAWSCLPDLVPESELWDEALLS